MTFAKRLLSLTAGLAAMAAVASGYYHFVHFNGRLGPYTPIPEKFDLGLLADRTLRYYISENGPETLAPNDSAASVISQIRAAARAWNDVPTSEMRLAFGGLYSPSVPQSGPAVEVIFDEIPPGLVALGGPTTRAELRSGPNGSFVPIQRSVVILRRDLSQRPSYSEGFYLTMVHEIGHALGLQHTFTSGVMSTEITRATTKARPLATDDVAAISLLYPARGFSQTTGTISGRVTMGAEGVNLASVVAISPRGPAVSTLTNPDGSYRIEGVPPGQYFVYAHPLPPALPGETGPGNIVPPEDMNRQPFNPGAAFDTVFYPGTRTPQLTVTVEAEKTASDINFSVTRRAAPAVYAVQTYSFPAQVAVKPAHLLRSGSRNFIVAAGVGLVSNRAPAADLQVSVLGGAVTVAPGGIRSYAPAPDSYLQLDFQFSPLVNNGPSHLLFSRASDVYVLPTGFQMVDRAAPSVAAVNPGFDASGNAVAIVEGAGLTAETQVLFDGAPATLRGADENGSRLTVVPPPAPSAHRAAVVALNADGQSSLFMQAPVFFTYPLRETPAISISPAALPAGVDAMVEINGAGAGFTGGLTQVGFGSSDVIVRQVFVVTPDRLLVNVSVAPNAQAAAVTLAVTTGLRVHAQPFAFSVLPSLQRQVALSLPVIGESTEDRTLIAGGLASLAVHNLPFDATAANIVLSVAERQAPVLSLVGNRLTFTVPASAPVGPQVMRLQVGAESSLPVAVMIDPPPPVISSVLAGPGSPIDGNRPARPGEFLSLLVTGVSEAASNPGRVTINVGGVEHAPVQVFAITGGLQIQFVLDPTLPSGQRRMTVTIDGRTSLPYTLPVQR